MTRKILYIINPIAGTGSSTTIQKRIEQVTTKASIPFECIPSNAMGNYQEVGARITNEQYTDVVIAGGTSSPYGFATMFKETLQQADLPIKIGEVIKPNDPLFSVARGCLLAAEAAVK